VSLGGSSRLIFIFIYKPGEFPCGTVIKLTIPPVGIIIFSKSNPGGNHMIKQKIMAAVIFAAVLTINSYGYFVFNETENAFNPNPCEGCESYSTLLLGQLIIDGAGFFIHSNSQYQLFLKEVELSGIYGINPEALEKALDNAITYMELANETYHLLVITANNLEYNQTVLSALNHFDYYEYLYVNRLNPVIFKQVSQFLKAGDVRGCYQRFYTATYDILERLKVIRNCVDNIIMPKIADCWRLNQLYLETQLFGQYTAEIFMNIEY
jgi:hypothetical protein